MPEEQQQPSATPATTPPAASQESTDKELELGLARSNSYSVMRDWQRIFVDTRSDSIGLLVGALALAQGAMVNGIKSTAAHNYKYMELSQLLDITRVPLSENGLAVIQTHELLGRRAGPSVVTHTLVAHTSGEWLRTSFEIAIDMDMKMTTMAQKEGVAATYGRRYSLQAICGISAEKDTDGVSEPKQ